MIEEGQTDEVIVIEKNKNDRNKALKLTIRYEYDIQIKKIVTKHVIYLDKSLNISNYPVIMGILAHDHYKIYYNYKVDNAECNVHASRYLRSL